MFPQGVITAKDAKILSDISDEDRRIERAAFKIVNSQLKLINNSITESARHGFYRTNFKNRKIEYRTAFNRRKCG